LLAVVGFVIAYVLVVPLTCSTTTVPGGSFDTVCSSILGPDVHLAGTAGPANDAAILAGAAGGVIGAVGGLTLVAARPRRGQ
jgi:hypothetical protein